MEEPQHQINFADYRSLSVFLIYLSLAASLVITATSILYKEWRASSSGKYSAKLHFQQSLSAPIFLLLAICSLGFTWYYMLSFLAYSHKQWTSNTLKIIQPAIANDSQILVDFLKLLSTNPTALIPWLRNSVLFREAWEEVVSTPAKYWWSSQIFLITTIWAVILDSHGRRCRVPKVWLFMVLGQLVAISVGMNLFFATLAVSSRLDAASSSNSKSGEKGTRNQSRKRPWTPHWMLYTFILGINLTSIVAVPGTVGTGWFPIVLALPHLLLLLPTLFDTILPESFRILQTDERQVALYYRRILLILSIITAMFVAVKSQQYASNFRPLMEALYSHPACSSVGLDVIFCWLSIFP